MAKEVLTEEQKEAKKVAQKVEKSERMKKLNADKKNNTKKLTHGSFKLRGRV